MDYLDCALVKSVNLASGKIVNTLKHQGMQITHYNKYCKNLHNDARRKFLIWYGNGREGLGESFEAMKTSQSGFVKAVR